MSEALVAVFRGAHGEAAVIVGLLRSNGIVASLSTDSMGGARPDIGFVQGTRVLVPADDEDDARRMIEEAERAET